MLTFIPVDQIEEMENWDDSRINEKKEILAHELTELVHGKEEADKAQASARSLFSGSGDTENMPSTSVELETDSISIVDLMLVCGLGSSKGEIRRLIQQGGVTANGEKVTSFDLSFTAEDLREGVVLKKGKKVFHKAQLK